MLFTVKIDFFLFGKWRKTCSPGATRTHDLRNAGPMPYQLGYRGGCAPLQFLECNCFIPLGVVTSTAPITQLEGNLLFNPRAVSRDSSVHDVSGAVKQRGTKLPMAPRLPRLNLLCVQQSRVWNVGLAELI